MFDVVIADTSCLIALDNIDHLEILKHLFGTINITVQVKEEFGKPIPHWFKVHEINSRAEFNLLLDPGEASSLTLAFLFESALVIIDEKKGRKVAQDFNINIIGTLKILLLAKQKNIIPKIKPLIALLEQQNFRFNKTIVIALLTLANET